MNCESWLHKHHYDVWLEWTSYQVERELTDNSHLEEVRE